MRVNRKPDYHKDTSVYLPGDILKLIKVFQEGLHKTFGIKVSRQTALRAMLKKAGYKL
jgi:hypothetical protein